MTIRNLEFLFKPKAVAVVGRGTGAEAPDARLVRNLIRQGFDGPIMPVNPERTALHGILCYPDFEALPVVPELALFTGPLAEAPAAIARLGERGTRAVLLLNDEMLKTQPDGGTALRQALLDAAKPHLVRIAGPDSFGLATPGTGLDATLGYTPIRAGQLGLVSQSCAITRSVLDWAYSRRIGFSHVLSVGAKIDVDFADMLDYLARDAHTRAILLYLENITDSRKFMSAARTAARIKPVVVLRPRRFGIDPAEDAVYDAAFRRAGMLRVHDIEQMFDSAKVLSAAKPVHGNRLAILGNSRSLGLLITETLEATGGVLAGLDAEAHARLAPLVAPGQPLVNPLDLGDRVTAERYGAALDALLDAPGIDGVLVLHAPYAPEADLACAQAVAERAARSRRMVITCWLGGDAATPARTACKERGVVTYNTPDDAVRAFTRLARNRRNLELLMETPSSIPSDFAPDAERARAVLRAALAAGRTRLHPHETAEVLAAYDIPTVPMHVAADPEAAAAIAARLGVPVALKIESGDIVCKSEVGGVAFWLETAEQVRAEAEAMRARVRAAAPEAALGGFLLQAMQSRGNAFELRVGLRTERPFGPLLHLGHGGTEAEAIGDEAYALPPLNMALAREMMSHTRIAAVIARSRARGADPDALALTLIKLSQMAIDLGELDELDINPLWLDQRGVLALDARIGVAPFTGVRPRDRLAIRPYPQELEQTIPLPDGRVLALRPIVPEDEPPLQGLVRRTPPEALRLRFFQPIRELSHAMAARLTQIDYYREMALVITGPGVPGAAEIYGVVRITAEPDLDKAEYAILVDSNMTGLGLGPMLMRKIIDYARGRGIREIYGEVLWENEPMLKLNRALGFTVEPSADDPGVMHVSLML